jgi:hypothetical protein
MDFITLIIIFIVIYIFSIFLLIIAWLLYLLCVLFNLKKVLFFVLPKFIQKPLWSIPEGIVTNSKPVFVVVTLFLVIMYILWLIIQLIIPEFILVIPIRKILSDIRPFPDLNNAGIFKLFDSIVLLFTTKEKLLKKLGISAELVGEFFLDSTKYIRENFEKNENKENKEFEEEIINNNKNENKEKIDKIIEIEKNNCLTKNNIQITPDTNEFDKINIQLNNIKNNIKCEIDGLGSKIQQNIVL